MSRIETSKCHLRNAIAVIFVLLQGCTTPVPSQQLNDTAVVISRRTPEEIRSVVEETFKQHHFEIAATKEDALVFDRRGTFANDMMAQNWADGPTWVRVKVFRTQIDADQTKLGCEIYVVQQPEDPMFKTERPYGGHKKEFKEIMQEVARALNH